MTGKTIKKLFDFKNWQVTKCNNLMILCNESKSNYMNDRDSNISKHRCRHLSFSSHIENLGRFWGTIKNYLAVKKFRYAKVMTSQKYE